MSSTFRGSAAALALSRLQCCGCGRAESASATATASANTAEYVGERNVDELASIATSRSARDPLKSLFRTDRDTGDVTCTACGTVQPESRILNTGKNWREFADDGAGSGSTGRNRRHAERVIDDVSSGLSTSIVGGFGTGANALQRLQSKHKASRGEAVLVEAFARISELCERLELPGSVRLKAKDVLRVFDQDAQRQSVKSSRLKHDACLVAALFVACRHAVGAGRSLKALCAQSGTTEKDVKRFFKLLDRDANVQTRLRQAVREEREEGEGEEEDAEWSGRYREADDVPIRTLPLRTSLKRGDTLSLQPTHRGGDFTASELTLPSGVRTTIATVHDLIAFYCNQLGMSYRLSQEGKRVAVRAVDILEGRRPATIAAACVLYVAKLVQSTKGATEIAAISGIGSKTIIGTHRELSRRRTELAYSSFAAPSQQTLQPPLKTLRDAAEELAAGCVTDSKTQIREGEPVDGHQSFDEGCWDMDVPPSSLSVNFPAASDDLIWNQPLAVSSSMEMQHGFATEFFNPPIDEIITHADPPFV